MQLLLRRLRKQLAVAVQRKLRQQLRLLLQRLQKLSNQYLIHDRSGDLRNRVTAFFYIHPAYNRT